jgi:hypothetical protein
MELIRGIQKERNRDAEIFVDPPPSSGRKIDLGSLLRGCSVEDLYSKGFVSSSSLI